MKTSKRDLLLIPRKGPVNKKRRYFNLRSAIRQATNDAVEQGQTMVIYDTTFGRDVATIGCNPHGINILVVTSNRIFKRLWSR